jgi:lipid-A-disaccharide synthase-like uncharacterized protein
MPGMGKKKKYSAIFIVSAELGILAGIVSAFYLVPASTPANLFWAISATFFAIINLWIFFQKRRVSDSNSN